MIILSTNDWEIAQVQANCYQEHLSAHLCYTILISPLFYELRIVINKGVIMYITHIKNSIPCTIQIVKKYLLWFFWSCNQFNFLIEDEPENFFKMKRIWVFPVQNVPYRRFWIAAYIAGIRLTPLDLSRLSLKYSLRILPLCQHVFPFHYSYELLIDFH